MFENSPKAAKRIMDYELWIMKDICHLSGLLHGSFLAVRNDDAVTVIARA
ncbi:MAG: hypothetical protein LBB31_04480 [Prevotellaceae bacterium]|nr:hypothetical protein [Prevotellaceae bacterium]